MLGVEGSDEDLSKFCDCSFMFDEALYVDSAFALCQGGFSNINNSLFSDIIGLDFSAQS